MLSCELLVVGDVVASCCARAVKLNAKVKASRQTITFFIGHLLRFVFGSPARSLTAVLLTYSGHKRIGAPSGVLTICGPNGKRGCRKLGKDLGLVCRLLDLFLARHHKFRRPKKGPLDLGIRESAERVLRRLGIPCSAGVRRFQRSVAP